eukprot:6735851-Lingulodinium_polyedra.AAC.1
MSAQEPPAPATNVHIVPQEPPVPAIAEGIDAPREPPAPAIGESIPAQEPPAPDAPLPTQETLAPAA